MKVAYVNNVSEKSIFQLNDLSNETIVPGMKLKLPIKMMASLNKNHVNIEDKK
jgi:LysM repeat protein